jgi:hypothetical protein
MRLVTGLKSKKRDIFVIAIWTVIMTLVMIKAHYILHATNPRYRNEGAAFIEYLPPTLEIADVLILIAVSITVVVLLTDTKSLVYGYFAAIGLTFTVSVIYSALFIWFILGYETSLSVVPFGWEAALYMGFVSMVWVMFPYILGISAIGAVTGAFIREWLTT